MANRLFFTCCFYNIDYLNVLSMPNLTRSRECYLLNLIVSKELAGGTASQFLSKSVKSGFQHDHDFTTP